MAKYDSSTITGKQKAIKRFNSLIKNECTFELRKVEVKTMAQHKYIHVLTAYFAAVYGCEKEKAKQYFFKMHGGNKDIFVVQISKIEYFVRSVNSLSKEESSISIDNFIRWSLEEAEIRLPLSDENRFLRECIIEIDRNRKI